MNESPEDFFAEEPDPYEQDGPGLFDDGETAPGSDAATDVRPDTSAAVGSRGSRSPSDVPRAASPHPEQPEPNPPEAPLALYRRYRPETFAEVIGQEHVTEPLQRALLNNKVTHAYLFSGPRGCGKTTSARILARALNCAKGPAPVPCGECESCIGLGRGGAGTVDVIEIDAASHGGVNEARDLRERAFFSPVAARYKIYIIDEAHMVTKEGFNALLKVVEEPPPHVKFIFATTEPDKVLGTIRSRTHHYPFRLVPPKVLGAYLNDVCEAEDVPIDPAVIPLVVRAGAGSVRDSLSVLDQLLGGASEDGVTYHQAVGLLGFTPDSLLDETVDAVSAGDAAGVFAAVEKVMDVGQDPRRFAEDLLRRLRDLLIVAAVPEALTNGLIAVSADQAERLRTQAAGLGAGELTRAAEVIATGLTEMRGTTAPRLHLELMLARVLLPGADVDERGVHARLDRLERRLAMFPSGGVTPVEDDATTDAGSAPQPAAQRPRPLRPVPDADAPAAEGTPAPSPNREHGRPDAAPPGPSRPAAAADPAPQPEGRDANVVPFEARKEQPRVQPAAPPPEPAASAGPGDVSAGTLRARWPEVLAEVKKRRRFTWILLSQNAQVAEVRDGVLTLDIANVGARESFGRGGSDQVLRDALVEVLGIDLRIAIDGQGAAPPPAAPPPPAEKATPRRSEAAAAAREAAARARHTPTTPETPAEPADEELDPNDLDLDTTLSSDELLASQLGAQLIGEEEPE
ncbi:DNA polymerase III subunit gamma and tau [Propionicicella superfundia]|uniref:DNA polymerase III subunit gamma and tau n=1 Tax=Propionicicella superfundia TaxID=348582 RepID=UPI00040E027C|nr:DNA polymerase III subunit gamma and tau [Propionicicella superfundia]